MGTMERSTAEHVEVRVAGVRRRVAMRADDWTQLLSAIPVATFARLRGSFQRFCDGCNHLPETAFRRVEDDPHGRLEEFVAKGVRVIGRRGTDEVSQTFFVTQVRIDDLGLLAEAEAPRQAMLPLGTVLSKGSER
jgi:hypothetical protein